MEQHLASVEQQPARILDPRPGRDLSAGPAARELMPDPFRPPDALRATPATCAATAATRPHARWPGNARVAVQFVLNYEEGGENSVLHGDAGSEQFLSEMFNPPAFPARHLSMEGIYEYGSRVGVWRILREFERAACR
jgi:hypothetical protein